MVKDLKVCNVEKIGEGREGNVYKINPNTCIKLYHKNPEKRVIDLGMTRKLSYIDTSRVILPDRPEFDDGHNFRGYRMPLVEEDGISLYDYDKDKLVSEFDQIKTDLVTLGEEGIEVGDIRDSNTITNKDGFYLIDCGDYLEKDCYTGATNIGYFNHYIIHDFLLYGFFDEFCDEKIIMDGYDSFVRSAQCYDFVGDYFKEHMKDNETLGNFVSRKVRCR